MATPGNPGLLMMPLFSTAVAALLLCAIPFAVVVAENDDPPYCSVLGGCECFMKKSRYSISMAKKVEKRYRKNPGLSLENFHQKFW